MKLKFRSKFNHGFTIIIAIYKVLFEKFYTILTLLMMDLFFGAVPLPKIRLTYPTMMRLDSYILPKEDPKNV